MSELKTSDHARALATVGASRGGKVRAQRLSADDRREIATKAAEARWGSDVPRATHAGQLRIAGQIIDCAVLENGKRLLTQETFLTAIGRSRKAKAGTGSARLAGSTAVPLGMPPFLSASNLQPFITEELLEMTTPIVFKIPNGGKAYGFEARLLPMVCDVYLKARDERRIVAAQEHIVIQCDILMRGLAHVGIIALVDEATGYQEQRARDELSKILDAYISEELRPWVRTFPDEFFRQVYRIHNWEYKPGTAKRTPQVGKLINKWIYEQLPPGVLDELRERNPVTPKGYRKHKHHQMLTSDTGIPHLDRLLASIVTLMKAADDKDHFERMFERVFSKTYQARLPLEVPIDRAV